MIYKYTVEQQETNTYINWSLSTFNTSDFQPKSRPNVQFEKEMFGEETFNHLCRQVLVHGSARGNSVSKINSRLMIPKMGARCDQDLSTRSLDLEESTLAIELSCHRY